MLNLFLSLKWMHDADIEMTGYLFPYYTTEKPFNYQELSFKDTCSPLYPIVIANTSKRKLDGGFSFLRDIMF